MYWSVDINVNKCMHGSSLILLILIKDSQFQISLFNHLLAETFPKRQDTDLVSRPLIINVKLVFQ